MKRYFNFAAIIFVKLNKFGETEIMNQYRKNKTRIYSDVTEIAHLIMDYEYQEFDIEDLKTKDIARCLSFLLALDTICESSSFRLKITFSEKPLNSEYNDHIDIFLTFTQQIRHGNSAKDDIAFIFNNLIFFVKDKNIFKQMNINNVYIDDPLPTVKLAFIPYPKNCPDISIDADRNPIFTLRTELNENDGRFLAKCKEAVDGNCHIIFGPEMHGSPPLDRKLKDFCCRNGSKIVICPSYHITVNGKKLNQTTIYVFKNNRTTPIKIKKSFPAMFYKNPPEPIDDNLDYNIALIHIKEFGKIAVLICKDYLTKNINELIVALNIDLIIIQSFSDKTSDFITMMEYNASNKQCLIMGNSCYATRYTDNGIETTYPLHLSKYNYCHTRHEKNTQTITKDCKNADCLKTDCKKIFEISVAKNKLSVIEL